MTWNTPYFHFCKDEERREINTSYVLPLPSNPVLDAFIGCLLEFLRKSSEWWGYPLPRNKKGTSVRLRHLFEVCWWVHGGTIMSTNPVPMQFVYSNFSLRKICSLALQMDGPTVFCFCLFLSLLLNYFLGIHSQSEITESKCMNTFMAFCLYCQIAITKGCTLVFCHQLYGKLYGLQIPVLRWGSFASKGCHT